MAGRHDGRKLNAERGGMEQLLHAASLAVEEYALTATVFSRFWCMNYAKTGNIMQKGTVHEILQQAVCGKVHQKS